MIRLPVCKTGVFKQAGSDDWSITSTSHHFGLVAWDREAAGGNPVIPTISNLLSWSKISGSRLLSGIMQVRILPAAPLPDSVKVARRPVKPCGVGASPTLAANFWKAGRYKLAAPVSKTGSASPRSEHYRRLPPRPVAQKQSTRLITGRRRSVTCQDDHFPE